MPPGSYILNQNKIFFAGLLSILLFGILFLIIQGKEVAFVSLNGYHPFFLNVFFVNYTFLGNGIFALCLSAIMFVFYKRYQCGFALLFSFLISGIAAQILKNVVIAPRPKLYFEEGSYLHFIDGVTLTGNSGFPSGHTATAFGIATVLALMMKNKNWQLPVLFAAVLVAYSRIYLAQHFLLDVIIGAIIGSVSGILAVYIAKNIKTIRKPVKKIQPLPKDPESTPSSIQST